MLLFTPTPTPASPSPALPDFSIAWEALPIQNLQRLVRSELAGAAPVWSDTLPFDAAQMLDEEASEPFSEPLPGLTMREVRDRDIFRMFFGR